MENVSIDQLIPPFLKRLLGTDDITGITWQTEFQSTEGYWSHIIKLVLYRPDGKPSQRERHFLVKMPNNIMQIDKSQNTGIFNKEVFVYETLLPRIDAILQRTPDTSVGPRYYGTLGDDSLVMDDLRNLGYRATPTDQMMDVESLMSCFELLAQCHAATIKLDEDDPTLLDKFKPVLFIPRTVADGHQFGDRLEQILHLHMPNFDKKYGQQFAQFKKSYLNQILEDIDPEKSDFNVLNHTDLNQSNILFKRGPDGHVQDTKFIDFQMKTWMNPVMDIMHLLMTSTTYDVYKKYGPKMLAHYSNSLESTMARINCQREFRCTVQDLMRNIDQRTSFSLLVVSFYAPLIHAEDRIKSPDLNDEGAITVEGYTKIAKPWLEYLLETRRALNRTI